jgi:hypothetical protein
VVQLCGADQHAPVSDRCCATQTAAHEEADVAVLASGEGEGHGADNETKAHLAKAAQDAIAAAKESVLTAAAAAAAAPDGWEQHSGAGSEWSEEGAWEDFIVAHGLRKDYAALLADEAAKEEEEEREALAAEEELRQKGLAKVSTRRTVPPHYGFLQL